MSDLERIVYLSSASRTFDPDQMHALCAVSQRNNRAADITGILLYVDGSFLQVIEGPPAPIDALLLRMRSDRRHSGMLVLERVPARERFFAGWSMESRCLAFRELGVLPSHGESFPVAVERLSASSEGVVVSTFLRNFFRMSGSYAA